MYRTEPPTDKTIREWYMKFQQSGCLCAAKRRGRPGPSEVPEALTCMNNPVYLLQCNYYLYGAIGRSRVYMWKKVRHSAGLHLIP